MIRRRALLVLVPAMTLVVVACASFRADDGPPPVTPPDDAASEASDAGSESSATEAGPIDAEAGAACDPAATIVDTGLVACGGNGTLTNDLSNDAKNCGRCGHDCLGGACAAGLCQPITIFTEPLVDGGVPNSGAFAIGVAGGYVYWGYPSDVQGSASVIRRGHVDGGGPLEELGQSGQPIVVAAVDDQRLYYAYDTQVFVLVPASGPQGLDMLASPLGGGAAMALSPDHLYVADGRTTVSSIALSGGPPGPSVIKGNASAPTWLVVDGAWTAWLEAPWETDGSDAGASVGISHEGGLFTVPVGQATALTTYGGAFYWFDVSAHRIDRLVEEGPPSVEELATVPVTPARRAHGLVVDGSRAYLGAELGAFGGSLEVIELSLCGGPTNVRATNLPNVFSAIVGDDTALYWGTYDRGIVRMAK